MAHIRLATRTSPLALIQAEWVRRRLLREKDTLEIELVGVSGDHPPPSVDSAIDPKTRFVAAARQAVLDGRADAAVHSAKDLPLDEHPDLHVVAWPHRASVHDCVVSRDARPLHQLPPGSIVGTSSGRRRAQILHHYPELTVVELRGNVDTRLRAVAERRYDAIVLAEAGLQRLSRTSEITEVLPVDRFVPCAAQGVLAIESRADSPLLAAFQRINSPEIAAMAQAERAIMKSCGANCESAFGCLVHECPDAGYQAHIFVPDPPAIVHIAAPTLPELIQRAAQNIQQ